MASPKDTEGTGPLRKVIDLLNEQLGESAKLTITGPGSEAHVKYRFKSTCNPTVGGQKCETTIHLKATEHKS